MATACHFNNFLGLGSSARGLIPLWILSILLCSLLFMMRLKWHLEIWPVQLKSIFAYVVMSEAAFLQLFNLK